ncbi:acyl-CoA dehydrogenase family member 11-like isoform X2 [Liolophura sinensis]|uniref:acyl-CoA dehydrogenase family member 11-like isoform X2 n=1 Tax=Liolophura sinensis TaxID=3198878 RepID=UPI0031587F04
MQRFLLSGCSRTVHPRSKNFLARCITSASNSTTAAGITQSPKSVIDRRYESTQPTMQNFSQSDFQELNIPGSASFPFATEKIGSFFQAQPILGNQYLEDVTIQAYLKRHVPPEILSTIDSDLKRFGQRVTEDIYQYHLECDRDLPRLERTDAWGNRVDRIITCTGWKMMHDIAAEEGLVAIPYERNQAEWSRLYAAVKFYLYLPSSGLYSCPLAMTDGAAKIIESLGRPSELEVAYRRLTSRNPREFWTSGQWMTERRGGSDVARGTETLAQPQPDGTFKLYGYKWFSSATDSDMTFTLARVMDADGQVTQGTGGLSLFYLETRLADGKLNNIRVQKLKNKLGTRQVPTAELLLDGVVAHKVSEHGRGVAGIANMLTLTRIHNSLCAAASMRRMVNFSRDYATRRQAFGKIIKDYPLHVQNLARMEVETRAATLFVLEVSRLLGREDMNVATDHEKTMLRLLTPLVKLYTGKQAMSVLSEGLESFGGQGYIEDTGLPVLLRDGQVLSIWEGTTNILSLDVLRAIMKSGGDTLQQFGISIDHKLAGSGGNQDLADSSARIKQASGDILKFAQTQQDSMEMAARDFAYSLSRTYMDGASRTWLLS